MTDLYKPNFDAPDTTDEEQLEILEARRWDIYDDLGVVNGLIAALKNRLMSKGENNE